MAKETEKEDYNEALLKETIEVTAECIQQYGKAIIENTVESRKQLANSIEEAIAVQAQYLSGMHQFKSIVVLRDIGGILTDLNRILNEVRL
jgi:hypothetical protein